MADLGEMVPSCVMADVMTRVLLGRRIRTVLSRVTDDDWGLDSGAALLTAADRWFVVSWCDGGTCPRCSGYEWTVSEFDSEADARRRYQWEVDDG